MRAIWLRAFGPPEVLTLEETPDPLAGDGQVIVAASLAGITFIETLVRSGRAPFPVELPTIPGNGIGGVVAEVGAGVDPSLVGRRVITTTGGSGGYAERAAVDAAGLIEVPDPLDLADALALLADGRTAVALARSAAIQPSETVLVEAAAGGVGGLLVQLGRSAGATVVAAASGPRKTEATRSLGAHEAVDYRQPEWSKSVRAATGGIDVVFDGVGGEVAREAFGLLRRGGRMVSYGLASGLWSDVTPEEAEDRGVALVGLGRPTAEESRDLIVEALEHAAAGRLRATIGQRFALARAADAHAAIESRTTIGKTLLEV